MSLPITFFPRTRRSRRQNRRRGGGNGPNFRLSASLPRGRDDILKGSAGYDRIQVWRVDFGDRQRLLARPRVRTGVSRRMPKKYPLLRIAAIAAVLGFLTGATLPGQETAPRSPRARKRTTLRLRQNRAIRTRIRIRTQPPRSSPVGVPTAPADRLRVRLPGTSPGGTAARTHLPMKPAASRRIRIRQHPNAAVRAIRSTAAFRTTPHRASISIRPSS